jgi:two-component system response regulator DctR
MTTLPNPSDSLNVAIIDDDPGVSRSLSMLLETRNWVSECFERPGDFLLMGDFSHFHCLIIDVRMPEMSGLELFEELRRRTRNTQSYLPPVIFLSGHGDIPMVVHALKQGATDFLEKPVDYRVLLDTIGKTLQVDRAARSEHGLQAKLLSNFAELTRREREVLTEILNGYLNKQIADHLNVTTKTVEAHRMRICQKFNVRTGMELAAKLREVSPDLLKCS